MIHARNCISSGISAALLAVAISGGSVASTTPSPAASSPAQLLPMTDVAINRVQGFSGRTSSSSDLHLAVDDGTTYAASDDDDTRVQSLPGVVTSSHTVAYPAVLAGPLTELSTHIRARRTRFAAGTVQLLVYDGASLIATTPARPVGTVYKNFDDSFEGLSVPDGRRLHIKVVLTNSAGRGNIRYTQQWVDASSTPSVSALWIPSIGTPFMWLLEHPLDVRNPVDMGTGVLDYRGRPAADPQVYDIDGFDNSAQTVRGLHARGLAAICYLSAGTWENWRADASAFPTAALGSNVGGWKGERWLDVRQRTTVWPLMEKRLNMCAAKGFDAVEFDNVDGYTNRSGFPLTSADQLAYNKFLATAAHERGLSAGLKNDVDQLESLWRHFDFAINEQCNQYSECAEYEDFFIANGKAVFQIEYELPRQSFCPSMNNDGFDSQLMSLNLDGGRQPCR